jgi:hypothetical protein
MDTPKTLQKVLNESNLSLIYADSRTRQAFEREILLAERELLMNVTPETCLVLKERVSILKSIYEKARATCKEPTYTTNEYIEIPL